MKAGVIGLGYVGVPVAVAFAEAGHDVVGLDSDNEAAVLDFRGIIRGIEASNLVRL